MTMPRPDFYRYVTILTGLLLAGCTTTPEAVIPQGTAARGDPAKPVAAAIETVVATDPAVDADDPALWADPADPSRALLFGTDKTDGLYVHNLDGSVRAFFADGPLNNVDLRPGFTVNGRDMVLVAATERKRFGIMTYLLDPATLDVTRYGFIPTGKAFGEPYGFCMGRRGDAFYLVPNSKQGKVNQYRVTAGADGPEVALERSITVGSQPEGCVVDDKRQMLYVGEEDVGIWRVGFDPADKAPPVKIAAIDGQRLVADVEGLAIIGDGGADYLVASSQGDATYPVWRIDTDAYTYLGRFAVEGGAIDNVTGTDGLTAWSGPIGPFANGALAMHDTDDAPNAGQQNFKIVGWTEVKAALGIE
jgi:3-phytase